MSEEEYQALIRIPKEKLAKGITKEEALRSLQRAGHLDEDGNFTAPYQNLARAIKAAQKNKKLL